MPRVQTQSTINAPIAKVWQLAQDVENMPKIMPDLDEVKILEEEQTSPTIKRTVTEWRARIAQFNRVIHWVEEDIWNSEEMVCHFWQIRGDYSLYKGEYKFEEQGESTLADLEIEYRIDIPLLGALMQKVVKKLMQENCDTMLLSLKTEAERLQENS